MYCITCNQREGRRKRKSEPANYRTANPLMHHLSESLQPFVGNCFWNHFSNFCSDKRSSKAGEVTNLKRNEFTKCQRVRFEEEEQIWFHWFVTIRKSTF